MPELQGSREVDYSRWPPTTAGDQRRPPLALLAEGGNVFGRVSSSPLPPLPPMLGIDQLRHSHTQTRRLFLAGCDTVIAVCADGVTCDTVRTRTVSQVTVVEKNSSSQL
ncbi:hypothetical protein C8R45DRAFT_1073543 [Mycena sanguinolenta]|nr:hypothetical protein C8R45DRAFT_1073543 [Mycena sanguinolenta]